jgi:hypothetical protein
MVWYGQDRTGQDRIGRDGTGRDGTGQGQGRDRTRTGQEKDGTGQGRDREGTGQDKEGKGRDETGREGRAYSNSNLGTTRSECGWLLRPRKGRKKRREGGGKGRE